MHLKKEQMTLSFFKSSQVQILFAGLLATTSLVIFNACGSDDKKSNSAAPAEITFNQVFTSVMSNEGTAVNCKKCHSPGNLPYEDGAVKFDLTTAATAQAGLKAKKKAGEHAPECNGAILIDPSNPNGSYLLAALDKATADAFTGKKGCTPDPIHFEGEAVLSSEQIKLLRDWIAGGAQW